MCGMQRVEASPAGGGALVSSADVCSDFSKALKRSPIRTTMERSTAAGASVVCLVAGTPDAATFPMQGVLVQKRGGAALATRPAAEWLNYGRHQAAGYAALVDWGNARLHRLGHAPPHGNVATMTNGGSTDSIFKALLAFTNAGDAVVCDSVTYTGLATAARPLGRNVVGVTPKHAGGPLDADQLDSALLKLGKKAKMLYLVPTGGNPTGVTQDVETRRRIYAVARKHNLIILEDDAYDGLQLGPRGSGGNASRMPGLGAAPPSYLSMDVDGRVVRLETAAKLFAPGFRVGWVHASRPLVEKMREVNEVTTWSQSGLAAAVLHAVVEDMGPAGYEAHVRFVQAEYTRRRDDLVDALEKHVGPLAAVDFKVPADGMFLWLRLRPFKGRPLDAGTLLDSFVAAGVVMLPGAAFRAEKVVGDGDDGALSAYRVSFSVVDSPQKATLAAERIAAVLRDAGALAQAADAFEQRARRQRDRRAFKILRVAAAAALGIATLALLARRARNR